MQIIAFEDQRGVVAELPAQHWRNVVALAFDVVAEAVAAFGDQVEAIGKGCAFVQCPGGVQCAAAQAVGVHLAAEHRAQLGLRLLADDVEGAARVAAPVQHRGRAAQHFDALQRAGVRHVGIAAVHRKAVAIELLSAEAAHQELGQALATEVVAAFHPAGVIERVFQTRCADVFDDLRRHDTNRLWGFMDGGVRARGAGRASRAIALHGAVGALGGGGDLHLLQRQRLSGRCVVG